MKSSLAALTLVFVLLGCGGPSSMSHTSQPQSAIALPAVALWPLERGQEVYWTPFSQSGVQIQFADVPLRNNARVTSVLANSRNELAASNGMRFDALGRLWVLNFGHFHGNPGSVCVFDLPLTENSKPRYTFVLTGTIDPEHLTFDASGNLWVSDAPYNSVVSEYTGPFNRSGSLSPALTVTKGLQYPQGLAFDSHGNLYVANSKSSGVHSVAVFTAPVSNRQPYFLNGLDNPVGLAFDAAGNLYASDNYASLSAIVRYDSDHLKAGARPDVVNMTALHEIFEADFAFTASGDLYFTNCGTFPSIDWYPTSRQPFTARLAPSVSYSDDAIDAGCAWGIAIK